MSSYSIPLSLLMLLLPRSSLAQSFVGGTSPLSSAPYGLPASAFLDMTRGFNSISNASFPITGYNLSIPAGAADGTAARVQGWALEIAITPDISLSGVASALADKKKQFTTATTLRIIPPDEGQVPGFNDSTWRVCAMVFTGGLVQGTGDMSTILKDGGDGGCQEILSSDCINQLQVNSLAGNRGKEGGCSDVSVPEVCQGYFRLVGVEGNSPVGTGYEITPIGNNGNSVNPLAADRSSIFFAAGSSATEKGNSSSIREAEHMIWPVLMTWTHFAESGEVHDSTGSLSCVQAKQTVNEGEAASEAWQSKMSNWVLALGLGIAGALVVG
ncbi:hypothetical protein QBC36DRAFT_365620 [Triangularia setosa]|uniref:Uncharacterized protein n=1 Tax=Triangularia setosa TaxID=2587417 RepID=A0AAN6WF65_9PEZI|nr:hypothetical protein QBC36DRAFT_365620 [Podospora setosa]